MKLVRILQKFILFIYCLLKHKSVKLSYCLAYFNVTLNNINLIKRKGSYIYFPNNNKISINILNKFSFTINLLFELLNNKNLIVEDSDALSFIVKINELKFKVSSLSNMAVLYEIFIQRLYDISLNYENITIIDIGMNVGVASLFFANHPHVKAVYGYEPFPDTFNEALNNFNLNPTISSKIRPFNYGVSNNTFTKSISLYDSGVLSASTIDNDDNYGKVLNKRIDVDILSIIQLMQKVYSDFPENNIILKIDCEGEEYSIFESIKSTNLLKNVSCIMLEWHEKGTVDLLKILTNNNFQYFLVPNVNFNSGMIYAFKN